MFFENLMSPMQSKNNKKNLFSTFLYQSLQFPKEHRLNNKLTSKFTKATLVDLEIRNIWLFLTFISLGNTFPVI